MNNQNDKDNNNINRINNTPIINNYISNSPIINIYPFKNDNVSPIKTEKYEEKNNNENLIQFKNEINEDNNINICYKSYDFKDNFNNQDKNMNHYFSFSKYIYYNYEVDDKLSPQIIENSDDKNNSNDKKKEINIFKDNNNATQNQMNINKNGYYYVYCPQKKDISETPFNIEDNNKNYMFNMPDNNLKNKLGNNYLTKKKFYNEDFVDTNFLRFKNKNFSPDYTINKSRFINHKIVDKNKLNIRTPDYVIPSFVKRAISHEKPINLVKKYYDHNFIMEEDNEDETIFDDKKEIKYKSISKEQTSNNKENEKEKENKKLMSNDFLMNNKENNIKNIINDKLLGNEENSCRDKDGQNLVNKFINYMKEKKEEKNQCVMNLTNSDKISTSINSNNIKKDKSKIEDIINDSENQIETSIKVYNNIVNHINNENNINRNLYKSNFANINKDEKFKSEDISKSKIVKCEKKISIINIKALLNEIKKNNNVNQILENNKIKIMNNKNSNNNLNNINTNNSNILKNKKSDNKTSEKKNGNIKMSEENKFSEINKSNYQINNNDNEDKDKKYNKPDYKNFIINKNKIVIKGTKIIRKENFKKGETIKLKEQKKVNLKEKDNYGEKYIVKMYKDNSILDRSKINNTTTSFNKKPIIDISCRDKINLRMKYKINKKYNSKIINIDKVKDNILPNKKSINKFSKIRKLKTNLNIHNHNKSKKISVNNIIENFKKYNNIFKSIKFDICKCYKNGIKRNNSLNNLKLRKNDVFLKGVNLNNDSLDKIDKRIIIRSSNKSRNKANNLINFTGSKNNNKFKKIDKKKNYKYKYYNSKLSNLKNRNKNLSDYNINNSSNNTALQSQSQTNQLYISHNTLDYTKQYIKNNILKKFNNDFRYKTQSSSIKIYNKESLLKNGNPLPSDNLNFSSTSKRNNFKIIQNKLITKKDFPKTVMNTGKHKKINLFDINMFNLSNKFTSKRKIVRMTLIDPKIISEFDTEVLNKNNSRIISSINNSEDFAISSNFMFNSIHRNKKNLKERRNNYNNNKAKIPDYEDNDYKKKIEKEKPNKNNKKKDKIFYSTIDYTNDGNFYSKIIKDINKGNKK